MTTTLVLSTLLGAATSYPLLRWWNDLDGKALEKISRLCETASLPLLAAALALPFVIYPWSYAAPLLLAAALTTVFPPLPLVGLLLASPLTLLFVMLVMGVIIAVMIRENYRPGLPSLSLRKVAILAAVGIILTESLIASANAGLYPRDHPGFCAWVGGQRAVPALTSALRSRKPEVHRRAREELLKIGRSAFPALRAMSDDPDPRVRRDVAAILIKNGEVAMPAELLADALTDEELTVRMTAAKELRRIGDPALPSVISILRMNYRKQDANAAAQVALSGMSEEQVVPALLEAFRGDDDSFRHGVPLNQLRTFGPRAIPQLVEGLAHSDSWARWWARQALIQIGSPAVPALEGALRHPAAAAREEAAVALGQLRARSAVPALIEALNHQETRAAAAEALARTGDRGALPALIAQVRRSPDLAVIDALGATFDPSVIPVLTELLRNEAPSVRQAAFRALSRVAWVGRMNPVPELIARLEEPGEEVAVRAAEQLGVIGDRTVIPLLEEADPVFHARRSRRGCAVCRAIREIKSR